MCTEKTFKGIDDLLKQLPDEKAAAKYWATLRWENGEPICPYCFSKSIAVFQTESVINAKRKRVKKFSAFVLEQ